MTIAVDFDGTIVEHRYPEIGRERPFAIRTLLQLQKEHHILILWTVREGKLLQDAIDFCRERGLEFYAVNSNYPGEDPNHSTASEGGTVDPDAEKGEAEVKPACRKLTADYYIDDRNLGKLPDWGVIYDIVHNHRSFESYYQEIFSQAAPEKKSFFARLFGK